MLPLLYIVIPCFDNADIIPFAAKLYSDKLEELVLCKKISSLSKILFIDNGSRDGSWDVLCDLSGREPAVSAVRLGGYSGVNNALLCGLEKARNCCDIAVAADCLCSRDLNAIDRMIAEYEKGASVVFGVNEPQEKRFPGLLKPKKGESARRRFDPGFFLAAKNAIDAIFKFEIRDIEVRYALCAAANDVSYTVYKKRNTFSGVKTPVLRKIKEAFSLFFTVRAFPVHIALSAGAVSTLCSSVALTVILILNAFGISCRADTVLLIFAFSLQTLLSGILGEYIVKIMRHTEKIPAFNIIDTTDFYENSALPLS